MEPVFKSHFDKTLIFKGKKQEYPSLPLMKLKFNPVLRKAQAKRLQTLIPDKHFLTFTP